MGVSRGSDPTKRENENVESNAAVETAPKSTDILTSSSFDATNMNVLNCVGHRNPSSSAFIAKLPYGLKEHFSSLYSVLTRDFTTEPRPSPWRAWPPIHDSDTASCRSIGHGTGLRIHGSQKPVLRRLASDDLSHDCGSVSSTPRNDLAPVFDVNSRGREQGKNTQPRRIRTSLYITRGVSSLPDHHRCCHAVLRRHPLSSVLHWLASFFRLLAVFDVCNELVCKAMWIAVGREEVNACRTQCTCGCQRLLSVSPWSWICYLCGCGWYRTVRGRHEGLTLDQSTARYFLICSNTFSAWNFFLRLDTLPQPRVTPGSLGW